MKALQLKAFQKQFKPNDFIRQFMPVSNPLADDLGKGSNLVGGNWGSTSKYSQIVDPIFGGRMYDAPDTSQSELQPFLDSMNKVTKSGLHNPYKNVHRYRMLGDVMTNAASLMKDEAMMDYFSYLVMRTSPKSYHQAYFEVRVTSIFMENFAGDGVRMLANRGFLQPGDHDGQQSHGIRFPFGYTSVITPFNYPLEIPVLQMMGSLFMGNKVLVKPDSKTGLPLEMWIRMLHECGLPKDDLDFLYAERETTSSFVHKGTESGKLRMTLFTGSQHVADQLIIDTKGRVRLEDAGFDWKILGPDGSNFSDDEHRYVAQVCDQDAFALSGQKCSTQSVLFAHKSWTQRGILDKFAEFANQRNFDNLTIGPVLSWNNQRIKEHQEAILKQNGSELICGGKPLERHNVPEQYGMWQPTVVKVSLNELVNDEAFRKLAFKELFGPFNIVAEWDDGDEQKLYDLMESMDNNLTAAIVSNDTEFQRKVLGNTVNGTQYVGLRARTTGAPQNHWFGPCGHPLSGGIGTPEAIKTVWSTHREVIFDEGRLNKDFKFPIQS